MEGAHSDGQGGRHSRVLHRFILRPQGLRWAVDVGSLRVSDQRLVGERRGQATSSAAMEVMEAMEGILAQQRNEPVPRCVLTVLRALCVCSLAPTIEKTLCVCSFSPTTKKTM